MSREDEIRIARELREKYGEAKPFNTGWGLRIIGRRDEIHPNDAFATTTDTMEAALAYAEADLRVYGHETLGIEQLETGPVLSVMDLRKAVRATGDPLSDPLLPDNAPTRRSMTFVNPDGAVTDYKI